MAVISESGLRAARRRMVEQLLEERGIRDRRVLAAMRLVERHRFVEEALQPRAYGPYALPIGCGQRMPHPHTVAMMAESLRLSGRECVLEIGTGSGYQSAVLALLAREVWSLECLPELAASAESRLRALGIDNVRVCVRADLRAPAAPFTAIHVSAAVPEVPGTLLAQLASGGRLVIPLGRGSLQRLQVLVRSGDVVSTAGLGSCRFQPLRGNHTPVVAPLDPARPPGHGPGDRV
jgi:protein-L-isoaspartate(D-aspartate) O-methyltransferase